MWIDDEDDDDALPDLTPETIGTVGRLSKDLKAAATRLSIDEARFLVDAYYAMQRDRLRAENQDRALTKTDEPHDVLHWLGDQRGVLEVQVKRALDAYSGSVPLGQCARSITGIGPVIAAGLLANIDLEKAPTVGHIWRFAGLDPTVSWNKGEKRPWNASLKRLCFLLGESFVKVSSHNSDTYGAFYKKRKEYESRKNDLGDYADQAAAALVKKKFGKDTDAFRHYTEGHLPPARIHLRAKRWAVKLFLSHYHEVGYQMQFGVKPPACFAVAHLSHAHYIAPPNWPMALSVASKEKGKKDKDRKKGKKGKRD